MEEYPNEQPHPLYPEYLISRDGECYSKKSNKWLKHDLNSVGYKRFHVGGKKRFAHRLVAETYIPNYTELPCIDHMDRNRLNNKVENLRWITYSNNGQNRGVNKNNKLEIKNISYNTRDNCFTFTKQVLGKKFTKSFKTVEEATDYKIEWHIKNDIILL